MSRLLAYVNNEFGIAITHRIGIEHKVPLWAMLMLLMILAVMPL